MVSLRKVSCALLLRVRWASDALDQPLYCCDVLVNLHPETELKIDPPALRFWGHEATSAATLKNCLSWSASAR